MSQPDAPEFPAAVVRNTTDGQRALCVAHTNARARNGTLIGTHEEPVDSTECQDCAERRPQL